MPQLHLNVWTGLAADPVAGTIAGRFGALWFERGRVAGEGALGAEANAVLLPAGGRYRLTPAGQARWVRFELSTLSDPTADATADLAVADGAALLRLDAVTFPPGAVARRHVHAGPGFRVLTAGELEIIGDTARETATPGHVWFEPANSPVRAVAGTVAPKTGFVRFMVLPVACLGQPTIRVLDPAEAALPRLQLTHRYIDKIVQLSPG